MPGTLCRFRVQRRAGASAVKVGATALDENGLSDGARLALGPLLHSSQSSCDAAAAALPCISAAPITRICRRRIIAIAWKRQRPGQPLKHPLASTERLAQVPELATGDGDLVNGHPKPFRELLIGA